MVPEQSEGLDSAETVPGYRMDAWSPSLALTILWTILTLVLTSAAIALLLIINQSLFSGSSFVDSTLGTIERDEVGSTVFTIELFGLGILLLSTIGVLILHEAIHGLMFRLYGGRPTFGAGLIHRLMPILYCTAHGYWFSRGQFSAIVLAPVVLITVAGVVLMPATNIGHWLIVPVGVNFGGSVGDLWMAAMLRGKPSGTMVEDRRDGLRFYYPADHTGDRT